MKNYLIKNWCIENYKVFYSSSQLYKIIKNNEINNNENNEITETSIKLI